jgi:hypothetical protein
VSFQLFVVFEGSELHLERLLREGDRPYLPLNLSRILGCRIGKIRELNHVHDIITSPAICSLPFARPSSIQEKASNRRWVGRRLSRNGGHRDRAPRDWSSLITASCPFLAASHSGVPPYPSFEH